MKLLSLMLCLIRMTIRTSSSEIPCIHEASDYQFKYDQIKQCIVTSGIPRGGVSTNSVEDRGQREWGSGGSCPLVRGSGGSCNLVQEISFHIVKFS